MAACYKNMVNPKTEAAKLILFLSLTAFSGRIHDFLHSALAERYGGLNADYILRLLARLQLILILIYACRRFLLFCRKNCDSLLLLGIAGHRIPGLFCLANLPLFCLEIFLTAVLKPDFSGIGWSVILSGILNTFLILFGAILLMQSPLYKCRIFLLGAATIGAGGLLYASSLNYQSAYALLMQRSADFSFLSIIISHLESWRPLCRSAPSCCICPARGIPEPISRNTPGNQPIWQEISGTVSAAD